MMDQTEQFEVSYYVSSFLLQLGSQNQILILFNVRAGRFLRAQLGLDKIKWNKKVVTSKYVINSEKSDQKVGDCVFCIAI